MLPVAETWAEGLPARCTVTSAPSRSPMRACWPAILAGTGSPVLLDSRNQRACFAKEGLRRPKDEKSCAESCGTAFTEKKSMALEEAATAYERHVSALIPSGDSRRNELARRLRRTHIADSCLGVPL